jgi:hypothetical protein
VSYTGTDAWGQGRSGFSAMRGETALGEPGTKHEMWLCPCLGKFWVTASYITGQVVVIDGGGLHKKAQPYFAAFDGVTNEFA